MKALITLLSLLTSGFLCAQGGWEWEELTSMPESVSNNAVTQGYSGDTLMVYSFTGISEGLEPSDIHLKSWRYNTVLDEWQTLPDVDDFRGKIAAGANTINNIVYLIGGYHVFESFSESSSNKVHRFDCENNVWLTDGATIPVAIDDQVQAVWRDSLIYVVTGWSDNGNVNDVQIYDPAFDTWTAGTDLPNNNNYRAFGASGTIIGDTIYYFGGVAGSFAFNANNRMRKGVINPENPSEIAWEQLPNGPGPDGYRMAAVNYQNEAIWIGGAPTAYNFDGLAYSNGQGVDPLEMIRLYRTDDLAWETYEPTPFQVMDLRGIAQESEDSWIIAGGMEPNQVVSDRVFRIRRGVGVSVQQVEELKATFKTNKAYFELVLASEGLAEVRVFDASGRIVIEDSFVKHFQFEMEGEQTGLYFLNVKQDGTSHTIKFVNP